MTPTARPAALVLMLLGTLGLVAACSGTDDGDPPDSRGFHLSIGDSYAAGFRPRIDDRPSENTTDGFAWKVADAADLTLVNHSCSGITAQDYLDGPPCSERARPPAAPDASGGSEAESVTAFLDDHGDEVRLVTIILGGNDFQHCVIEQQVRECAEAEMSGVTAAIDELLTDVEARIGEDVPVIGLTYPNVFLGEEAHDHRPTTDIDATIAILRDVVNPALADVYAGHDATFVDVTAEFDGYVPPTETVDTDDYGTIPLRAATICDLTYFCGMHDIHPTPEGHDRLAQLVLAAGPVSAR